MRTIFLASCVLHDKLRVFSVSGNKQHPHHVSFTPDLAFAELGFTVTSNSPKGVEILSAFNKINKTPCIHRTLKRSTLTRNLCTVLHLCLAKKTIYSLPLRALHLDIAFVMHLSYSYSTEAYSAMTCHWHPDTLFWFCATNRRLSVTNAKMYMAESQAITLLSTETSY